MDNPNTKRLLSIGEAADHLGVSIDTLRRWEKKGRINPLRSPGGHRYYSINDLDALFGKRYTRDEETIRRTSEELGKVSSISVEPPLTPTEAASEQNIPGVVTTQPPAEYPLQTPDTAPPQVAEIPSYPPGYQNLAPQASPPQDSPLPEAVPATQQMEHSSTPNEAVPEKSVETIRQDTEVKKISILDPIPQKEAVSQPMQNMQDDSVSHIPNISLPVAGENQALSEEEIERRIGSIIKKSKNDNKTNIILGIGLFIILMIDTFILFLWFSSARIVSPIP